MSSLKIAIVGAGSFVFGPSILHQAIIEHRLQNVELALLDIDPDMLALMAAVGQRMAAESSVQLRITTHTDRATAFDGASFVISAAVQQMRRRFEMDVDIINRLLPGHLITEFGGIAGLSLSLRQIELVRAITDDMRQHCPQASLLNIANPLPRVCQAAAENGIHTVGFCMVALDGLAMAWKLLYDEDLTYPFTPARERWMMVTAGLNHFVWLTDLRDRATHSDLLPALRRRLAEGATYANPLSETCFRQTGYMLVPKDDHTRDFLPPDGQTPPLEHLSHGTALEREDRIAQLRRVGAGEVHWQTLLRSVSWERPFDLIEAVTAGKPAFFQSLNLLNEGQIPNLPRGIFVDTPVSAASDGLRPTTVELPAAVLPLCERTAQVTDTIVRAGMTHSRKLAHAAVELDPTVLDKAAGIRAIDACIAAHADILGFWT